MYGVSDDFVGMCEDRIARNITASDQAISLRNAMEILHKREKITYRFYRDACDALTCIDSALLEGKRAFAREKRSASQ